ncbi:peptidylprolyl isomerase [Candidatus Methylopumilus planktonicus]|nr:peptidylprolyl isomerase [Candidatus Methylopumilus planktonicus]
MKAALNLIKLVFVFFLFLPLAHAANPVVEFETNQGNFKIELYPEKAPKTVTNFLYYVNNGFYKETIFHRVISNFMIQGGGFTREMSEKATQPPIVNESNNGLLNSAGTLAMARTNDPNSATAQFFVNLIDNNFLNYTGPEANSSGYCVFGKVTEGMNVVRKIGQLPTGNSKGFSDVPIRPVIIINAKHIN